MIPGLIAKFHPNSASIISCTNAEILEYDIFSQEYHRVGLLETCPVSDIEFTKNGDSVAIVGLFDKFVNIWSIKKKLKLLSIPHVTDHLYCCSFNLDENVIVIGGKSVLTITELQSKRLLTFLLGSAIYDIAFSPDGKKFAYQNEVIDLVSTNNWKIESRLAQQLFYKDKYLRVSSLRFSSDGKALYISAVGKIYSHIFLWDVESNQLLNSFEHYSPYLNFGRIKFAVTNKEDLIISGYGNSINIWNLQNSTKIVSKTICGKHDNIEDLQISPNNKYLMVTIFGEIRVYDLKNFLK